MGISVKLERFEGPLDLLLHLIDKNKVDIFDIPIVEITNQYMEYLHAMETEDMSVMSEFLVMAATLLDIKARMLLPKEVNICLTSCVTVRWMRNICCTGIRRSLRRYNSTSHR